MAGIILPGNATPADVLTGTTFSAGSNYDVAGTMPNNGSPTYTPNGNTQTGAAGYYGGVTVDAVTVKVATYSLTSSAATTTFYNTSGSAVTDYSLAVPVPSGATEILAVWILYPASGTDEINAVATPSGYADTSTATCVCYAYGSSAGPIPFEVGGALSIGVTGTTLPVGDPSASYTAVVYYV